jgi:hypothetical protein
MGGRSSISGVVAFVAVSNETASLLLFWALLSGMGLLIWALLPDWDFGPFGPNSLTVTPHSPDPSPQLGLWGIISPRADRGSGRMGWLLALAYLYLRGHVASCLWCLLGGTSFDELSFRVLAVPPEDRPLIFLATRGASGAWTH